LIIYICIENINKIENRELESSKRENIENKGPSPQKKAQVNSTKLEYILGFLSLIGHQLEYDLLGRSLI
jgi:hypothetical protein